MKLTKTREHTKWKKCKTFTHYEPRNDCVCIASFWYICQSIKQQPNSKMQRWNGESAFIFLVYYFQISSQIRITKNRPRIYWTTLNVTATITVHVGAVYKINMTIFVFSTLNKNVSTKMLSWILNVNHHWANGHCRRCI